MKNPMHARSLEVFRLLEEGLDATLERVQKAAEGGTREELSLDPETSRELSARLMRLATKFGGLERFTGLALRGLAVARSQIGDPITDAETEAVLSAVSVGPLPLPFSANGPEPTAEELGTLKSCQVVRIGEARMVRCTGEADSVFVVAREADGNAFLGRLRPDGSVIAHGWESGGKLTDIVGEERERIVAEWRRALAEHRAGRPATAPDGKLWN